MKDKVEMPPYLKGYQPGDTVPPELFEKACANCSAYLQDGFGPWLSSDAAYFKLKKEIQPEDLCGVPH